MAHPDLPEEQKYVDHAYDCLEKKIDLRRNQQNSGLAAHPRQQFALNRALEANVDALDPTGQLLYGRMDDDAGEALYVGKHYLEDPETRDVVSISWKSDAAQAFFQADAEDPMGLVLRRRFVADDRVLHDLYDEWFDELAQQLAQGAYVMPDPPVIGQDALLIDLESRRTGEMREIVATIQAEQDRAIRAPMDGVFVIQGGPGTGKSAVGLHRAAVLLFQHEELRDDGILVVGPNPAFMKYIARVLPSLGESEVQQESITRLGPAMAPTRVESGKAERVKGDPRMAQVLTNALWGRVRPASQELALPGARVTIDETEIQALVDAAQDRAFTFETARANFIDRFVALVGSRYREGRVGSSNDLANNPELLRQHEEVAKALDRIWSTVSSREALRDLLTSRRRIADAADGILDAEEQALLLRERAKSLNEEKWSYCDLPLLDELEHMLRAQTVTYAHVIVDEAQDMSPMQLRMVARRSPLQSFTLLGDLAQATGHWTNRNWDDIAGQLAPDAPMRFYELSLGYRVPSEVMAYASRLLPFIAPDLAEPRSVRTWGQPRFEEVDDGDVLTAAVLAAMEHSDKDRATALIVPDQMADSAAGALTSAGLDFGDARESNLERSLTLVPAKWAKGLEFEATVVVEPRAIRDAGDDGLRVLYVALTRTTADLVVVHADRLPPELQETAATPGPSGEEPRPPAGEPYRSPIDELLGSGSEAAAAPGNPSANLDDLMARIDTLSERDRDLLAAIVTWLQAGGTDAGL